MLIQLNQILLFILILFTLSSCQNKEHESRYKGLELMKIKVSSNSIENLNKYIKTAKSKGLITKKEKKWQNAFLLIDKEEYKTKLRLKGDWADHISKDNYSLRLKLENKFWNRVNSFSLQLPKTRDFLNEWVYHKMLEKENILTPRYEFIEVMINGSSKGLYAFEEHFSKQLIEYNHRREGPILKFNEDRLWKIRKKKLPYEDELPIFDPAITEAFKMKKVLQKPSLKKAFIAGQSLMYNFKFGLKSASDVFDVKQMAKFIAIMDINKAYHNFIWNNLRFYYNPIIQKLEPIGFDGFTSEGPSPWVKAPFIGYYKTYNSNYISNNSGYIQNLFCDSTFVNLYVKYLYEYSDSSYVQGFLNKHSENIGKYESAIKVDSNQYSYNRGFLYSNCKKIRKHLPEYVAKLKSIKRPSNPIGINKKLKPETKILKRPKYFINAYKASNTTLELASFLPEKAILTGMGKKKKKKKTLNVSIPAYDGTNNKSPQKVNINYKKARVLFFKTISSDKEYKININPWPAPTLEITRQTLLKNALSNTSLYNIVDRKITFKKGKHQTSKDIIIPSGYSVEFKAGHELDLIDSAKFISFSPVNMNGNSSDQINIFSSDHTAKGFSVLLNEEESSLNYVNFKGFGTLDEGNWYLTGAVTFYKTMLDMQNCKIDSNHCEDALNTINSKIKVKNCVISNTYSDGYDSDFCTGTIENCTLFNTGNDALDFSGSKVNILNCKLDNIGDKGISCGEESSIEVDSIDISNAVWGIASKDLSKLVIRNSQISKCQIGMNAFVKKSEYGGASIKSKSVKLIDVDTIKSNDKYSSIFLD